MDVSSFRDWIIIILGILEILLIIGLIVVLLVVYSKVNKLITKGKETVMKFENAVASPYLKVGAWLLRTIASGLGVLQKRNSKGD